MILDSDQPAGLSQRRFLEKRQFWLLEDGVRVLVRGPRSRQRYFVPFLEIGRHCELTGGIPEYWVILMAIAWFATGFTAISYFTSDPIMGAPGLFFMGSVATFLSGKYINANARFVGFDGNQAVFAFRGRPTQDAVSSFLSSVDAARRRFLKESVGVSRSATVSESITQLHWLNQRGALSDSEFEELKALEIERTRDGRGSNGGYV